jgi:sugar phosphate isomerase/epimerase
MKLGITQYAACPVGTDGRKLLEHVAELGLAGVEPFFCAFDDEFLVWSAEQVRQFVVNAKELDVEIPSTGYGAFNMDSCLIDKDELDKAVKHTIHGLEQTAAMGGGVMLLCTFLKSHPDTPEKKTNLLKVIDQVEPRARDLGVKIALESPLGTDELIELVKATKSDQIGVYYDLGNAIALGFDPLDEIETLGEYILEVHVKDSAHNVLGGLHLGQGNLDLSASISVLKKNNYDGWLIIETPLNNEISLINDIETLRQLL